MVGVEGERVELSVQHSAQSARYISSRLRRSVNDSDYGGASKRIIRAWHRRTRHLHWQQCRRRGLAPV